MKTRDLIIESYLLITVFALFCLGIFSLFDYAGSQSVSAQSVVLLPDSALCAVLMSGFLLSVIRQSRALVILFVLPLMALCLYSLLHNYWAGGAEIGHSWVSGFLRMRSELAFTGMAVILAALMSSGGGLARRMAQAIGGGIVLLAIVSQQADFHPALGIFKLGFKHASSNIANLFAMTLGITVICLTLLSKESKNTLSRPALAVGFIGVFLACTGWYALTLQNGQTINRESRLLLAKTQASIVQAQEDRMALLMRMSERWQALGALPSEGLWQQEVRSYLRDFPGLGLIAVLDQDLTPLLQGARDQQQGDWLTSFLADHGQREWLEHSLAGEGAHLSPVSMRADGTPVALIASKLTLPGQGPLLVVASLDIRATLQQLSDQRLSDLSLRLYEGDILIFNSAAERRLRFTTDVGAIDIPTHDERKWRLVSSLGRPHIGSLASYLPLFGLMFGLTLSGLLMLSMRLLRLNNERSVKMEKLNTDLQVTLAEQLSLQALNRRIMQFSRDVFCSIDKHGCFIEISPSCKEVFGYTSEELIGQSYIQFVLPEDRQFTEAEAESILAGNTTYSFRNRYRHRDGRIVHILWSADGSADSETVFCVAHDISALVRTQTYAETQRDILSLIVTDHPEKETLEAICLMVEALEPDLLCSILQLDEAGVHLHTMAAPHMPDAFNQAIEGVAIGPKVGSCGTAAYRRQLVVTDDIASDPLWEDYRELALANDLRSAWSFPLVTVEGRVLGTFALYSHQPYAPNQEQIQHMSAAAQLATIAITRARDRQTLQASEQRFRSLFTFNPDAIYSFDLDGHFQQVNGAMLGLTGLAEEQIIHQHFSALVIAEDLERTEQHFISACKGIPQRYEARVLNSHGQLLHLDVCNMPIIVDGQIIGVFGIAKDISEREQMNEALHRSLLQADKRAVQLRGLSEAAITSARLLEREALIDYLIDQVSQVFDADQVLLLVSDRNPEVGDVPQEDNELLGLLCEVEQALSLSQHELDNDTRWSALIQALGRRGHAFQRGLLIVPLLDSNELFIGVLLLLNVQQDDFDLDDLVIAQQFAQMAVSSLQNIHLINAVIRGESSLKTQLAFTSAITDSLSEGLVAIDNACHITFANPAAEKLLGVDQQQLLGQPLSRLLPLDCSDWCLQGQHIVDGELILSDSATRTLRYYARPLLAAAGQSGWVVAIDDVTAQRKGDQAMRERNQFFDLSLEMFCMVGLTGELLQVNPAFAATLHYTEERLIGKPYMSLIHIDDQAMVSAAVELLREGQSIRELIIRVWDSNLHLHWLQFSAALSEDRVIYCAARDITQQKESEQQLRLFKRSLASSYNGIVIVDALAEDQPIIYVNAAFERITGYSSDEITGRNCRFLQGSENNQKGVSIIREGLAQRSDVHVVLRNFRKDGSPFWNDLYISPILNEAGTLTHFVGVQNDISEERRYQEELSFNASHDVLTGLPNRTLLVDRLAQSCQVAMRYGRRLAVMFIDLDGFKQVNDSNGHYFGDQVLKEVAKRLSEQLRPGDTVARMGGDEFVVLLADLAQEEDIVQVAERILGAVAQPYQFDETDFHTSASIGITLSDGSLEEPMQLIQQADMAMYKAKQDGRNNYQWFTNDLSDNVRERVSLRGELQKAIEENGFQLYYQPQIDSRSGQVVGMEALIRWKHASRGFISPMTLISVAEESGQIIPISLWVLDTACRQIRVLAEQGMSKLTVAVNISSVHFRRKDFFESIVAALSRHQINPQQLELEITESVLLNETERTIECLQKLKSLGIGLAIDDFGTGYSSLIYLKRLPISKVKIDRSFITDIIRDSDDAAITRGIISMAHHLRMKVIAEGVEDESQWAFLKRAHCDEFQGYYFARPMPFAELQVFLRERMLTQVPDPLLSSDHEPQQTLLLLDDEENILRSLTRLLRRDGYKILMATRAQDAFEILAKHDVQVVLSDQRMPEMNGTEFLRRVKDLYPNTVRIVLSGYTDLKSVTDAINEGAIYKFLTKPWDDDQLRQSIAEAFRSSKPGLNSSLAGPDEENK